ncbi:MAG: GldG family protein [Peptococcaceae bacterium]|jgi:ABC-2 type transport system permease protein|nr:GldG family protein [Peptococcaceae bacterium]
MNQKFKQLLTEGASRQGTYAAGITAIVIAIVIVLNLIVGQLPSHFVQLDITDNKLYTITETSKNYLANLDKEVEIMVVAEQGRADERITKFLDKYAALSPKIIVTEIDPVLNPSVLATYDIKGDSLVVNCKDTGKHTIVPFTQIIVYDMYSYYTTGRYTETEFDAEGQLTSAVDYVVRDSTTKVYTLEGHGESTLPVAALNLIDKANINTDTVNLLTAGGIPKDCDLLISHAPEKDLANDELSMIKSYLAEGGKLLLLIDSDSLANFNILMGEYGMNIAKGYIADPGRSYQSPYYLLPHISTDSVITSDLDADAMTLIINARGMTLRDPARDSITTESFLTSSEDAYAVTENNQVQGTYSLGATAVETIDSEEGKVARLTVITSSSLIAPAITDNFANVSNLDIFMKAVSADFKDAGNISIKPKSLEVSYNTIKNAKLWSVLFIFIIPLVLVVGGFMFWLKRRKL